ncbi:diguanylate cyclase/phosphodiesterase with extracellular sensor [Denitrovibrio acetiphilus DSM 12809]|uniref:Diguanylate cyclase/phosphodiesterase with extracellular sensor n=1 Tax=Denitrovibrio acetiphilus (strain DSM 12809 / NBRC 114555 / N2460) TaxID=522772 RepID=D4H1V0_DENA2|nr:LapD/MoxY N-terminal periplasmic domain-containing protein [Denitrovibrio acetiphilus]ADD66927.1 diguanylate cyclase/phosphodiesterase with extracellular sensor [Denitrovibrio acetiphilus DSM 12809]
MTLFRQIQIFVTLLLVVMLIVVLKINFDSTREFVRTQLYSDAKNTANSLSLSLSTVAGDEAAMVTMMRAMFDGGYYEEIKLINAEGKVIGDISQKPVIEGVPGFFIRMVDFENIPAEAQISSGWTIFGTLSVKGHPGLSYIRLWDSFKYLGMWFVIIGLSALAATHMALRLIFRPLGAVREQAAAIENNEFIINKNIPSTPEMKQVVITMNSMVSKAQAIYNREIETLKNYQELLYKDQSTGLFNRKYFVSQLSAYLQAENENSSGEVVILSFEGMEDAAAEAGHSVISKLFSFCVDEMQSISGKVPNSVPACLNNREFALILPGCDTAEALVMAKTATDNINNYIKSIEEIKDILGVFCGAASYRYDEDMGKVLSKVDYAVTLAKSKESGAVERYVDDGSHIVLGKMEWKHMIETALGEDRFILTSQPVVSDGGELHQEIYVNMVDSDGKVQRAGFFMPMVISLNLANSLDRYVLEKTVDYLTGNKEHTLAINITDMFLNDRGAFSWFRKLLVSAKHLRERLTFEISDSAIKHHLDICLDFSGLIKGLGFTFGVDRFAMSQESLENLQQLKPDYLKVDYDYLINSEDGDVAAALKSLQTITDSLGIKLIATKIDSEELRQKLEDNNIKYFQGRGVAGINPLGKNNE